MTETKNETPPVNTPKEAALNLVKSVRSPLIWFGIGFVSCMFWNARRKKLPS